MRNLAVLDGWNQVAILQLGMSPTCLVFGSSTEQLIKPQELQLGPRYFERERQHDGWIVPISQHPSIGKANKRTLEKWPNTSKDPRKPLVNPWFCCPLSTFHPTPSIFAHLHLTWPLHECQDGFRTPASLTPVEALVGWVGQRPLNPRSKPKNSLMYGCKNS